MLTNKRVFALLSVSAMVLAVAVSAHAGGDDTPQWLRTAAAQTLPPYERTVPAVVLVNDETVTVREDGHVETSINYAVKILNSQGKDYAEATAPYLSDSGKVKEIHAWLIRPGGEIKKFGKDEIIDAIGDQNDVYNEVRVRVIDGSREAQVGAVFGYTATIDEHEIFGEDEWLFQHRLPTLSSHYSVTLPTGWKLLSKMFNHPNVDPTVNSNNYTWELNNLGPIRIERQSPAITNLAPRLVVGYLPPDGQSSSLKAFSTWAGVSSWLTEIHDPQVTLDDAIATKARDLTADSKTELDKIRAIGKFVQNIQYISIDIGVGKGNGLRPHSATQVFAKMYGDCKDKANLMRTMLKALHITAYPVAIYSGDRNYVREEWASPGQFNHCIIAIKVSDETQVPTVVTTPELGRLLIFDATDPYTPVGDLPDHEQGSFALLIAGDKGGLLKMPVTPPESNLLERRASVNLSEDGSVKAEIHERSVGQAAVRERGAYKELPKPDYRSLIEEWITRGAPGAKVSTLDTTDSLSEGRFGLDVSFTAEHYGQLMQNKLLVFKPAVVSRSEFLALNDTARSQPIVLNSRAYKETVEVTLPKGFDVDETPDPVKIDTAFGSYQAKYEVKDGKLLFTRSLVQKADTIPVSQYASVKDFFERIRAAEQSPVVLARK